MDCETVFGLAEPYLKKNDFGMPHTRRVFDLAKRNFEIPKELEELDLCTNFLSASVWKEFMYMQYKQNEGA